MRKQAASGCPVLSLARRFEELALQLDDAEKPDGIENAVSLGIKMAEIGEAASHLSPKTRAGAAFQIMLASAEVDVMQTVADPDDVEASKLLVQRLLYRSLEMMRAEVAKFPRSRAYMMAKDSTQEGRGTRDAQSRARSEIAASGRAFGNGLFDPTLVRMSFLLS